MGGWFKGNDIHSINKLKKPEHIKDEIKKREYRIEDRKYHNMTKDVTRTNNRSLLLGTDSVKDYEKSMNFAISFIFSIFASALVGYYLGIYFFKFPHDKVKNYIYYVRV
jgi:hypothetical protein